MPSELFLGEKYRPVLSAVVPNAIWLPDNPYVDSRLSGHADLCLFSDGSVLYASPYLQKFLSEQGIEAVFTKSNPGKAYPSDARFNIFCNESCIVYNSISADPEIISKLADSGKHLIEVSQGYSACSILGVDSDSFITADEGIYRALEQYKYNVLKIAPGYISLEGFGYGFIGGSAIKPDESTVAFTGSLSGHPDCDRIIGFIKGKGKSVEFLTNFPVFDIGGAVIRP